MRQRKPKKRGGDLRVPPANKRNGAPKGHPKWGGRKKGTPNKIPTQVKDLSIEALTRAGEHLVKELTYYVSQLEYQQRRARRYKELLRETPKHHSKRKMRRARYQACKRRVAHYADRARYHEQFACGGALAGMLNLYYKEPAQYLVLLAKLLPMQIQGKVEVDDNRRYETVDDVLQLFKERNLPMVPMIDVTPRRLPTPTNDYDDTEEAA